MSEPDPTSEGNTEPYTWNGSTLCGISPKVTYCNVPLPSNNIPAYFWGNGYFKHLSRNLFPMHTGYNEAREIIGKGDVESLEKITRQSMEFLTGAFGTLCNSASCNETALIRLNLSAELQDWRDQQHKLGRVLPPKGTGLKRASPRVLEILHAADWPEALITNNALFGCGIASLLLGAYDVHTMFSNYVTDMAFYHEHGYQYAFPDLDRLISQGTSDVHACQTPGGIERRAAVQVGIKYIKHKIALEQAHKASLAGYSARLDRRMAQTVSLCECSLLGMAEETIVRGFDPAGVMSDLVFGSPGTDVVDVGGDLVNSEIMNSFLNTADITETGVVTEERLRRVYDAYAHTGARMLTERWAEPTARMCAALYTWHIQNDRNMFLRRAILGWPKVRKGGRSADDQREADFDEAFDERYHTTGFSRPLRNACNGEDTCDVVDRFLANTKSSLLPQLWEALVIDPLRYVRKGTVDRGIEERMEESLRILMVSVYSEGLVLEMVWLIAHANHHAWQVNRLFEAAMFGSLLDSGALVGKLDRVES
ncbi:MAG: hypothetical protein Q9227_000575 [Pyrenula ochraceoflavens]